MIEAQLIEFSESTKRAQSSHSIGSEALHADYTKYHGTVDRWEN